MPTRGMAEIIKVSSTAAATRDATRPKISRKPRQNSTKPAPHDDQIRAETGGQQDVEIRLQQFQGPAGVEPLLDAAPDQANPGRDAQDQEAQRVQLAAEARIQAEKGGEARENM